MLVRHRCPARPVRPPTHAIKEQACQHTCQPRPAGEPAGSRRRCGRRRRVGRCERYIAPACRLLALSLTLGSTRITFHPPTASTRATQDAVATVSQAAPALLQQLDGKSPGELLCIAARRGLAPLARLLLQVGCSAESHGSAGVPPLLLAAQSGHADVVAALLEAGAAVNPAAETAAGEQPIEQDSNSGSSRRNSSDGRSRASPPPPLVAAGKAGHAAIVRLLLQAGADPAVTDSGGCSALWHAADRTHSDVVRLLLEQEPPELVDRPNQDGCTP